jgi:hypothetical protein
MAEIAIVNVRYDKSPDIVYVGRRMPSRAGSPLGNPFKVGKVADPMGMYRSWLWEQVRRATPVRAEIERLAKMYKAGNGIKLGCWCSPNPCHAEIIAACIRWYASHGNNFA